MIGLRFYVEKTETVKRKLSICASKSCNLCPFGLNDVPESCEHIMKHILYTDDEGFVIKGRRTGKTTEIIRRAKKMIDGSYDDVIVFVMNQHEAMRLQKLAMGTGIQFMRVSSRQDINRALLGLSKPNAIFTDELAEWVAKEVMENTIHHFVLGYYTP